MKKIFCILLSVTTIFTGCATQSATATELLATDEINSKANIVWNNQEYNGEIIRDTTGELSVTLTSQELKTPVTFVANQETIARKQGELSFEQHINSTGALDIAVMLRQALITLSNVEGERDGELLVITQGGISTTVNAKLKKILSVKLPNGEILFL